MGRDAKTLEQARVRGVIDHATTDLSSGVAEAEVVVVCTPVSRIPQDVRMVGINDVKYASFLPVPLTTLRQPCPQIGAAAMRVMLERLQAPDTPVREVLLNCELVVRQSCGTE